MKNNKNTAIEKNTMRTNKNYLRTVITFIPACHCWQTWQKAFFKQISSCLV